MKPLFRWIPLKGAGENFSKSNSIKNSRKENKNAMMIQYLEENSIVGFVREK